MSAQKTLSICIEEIDAEIARIEEDRWEIEAMRTTLERELEELANAQAEFAEMEADLESEKEEIAQEWIVLQTLQDSLSAEKEKLAQRSRELDTKEQILLQKQEWLSGEGERIRLQLYELELIDELIPMLVVGVVFITIGNGVILFRFYRNPRVSLPLQIRKNRLNG